MKMHWKQTLHWYFTLNIKHESLPHPSFSVFESEGLRLTDRDFHRSRVYWRTSQWKEERLSIQVRGLLLVKGLLLVSGSSFWKLSGQIILTAKGSDWMSCHVCLWAQSQTIPHINTLPCDTSQCQTQKCSVTFWWKSVWLLALRQELWWFVRERKNENEWKTFVVCWQGGVLYPSHQ